MLLSVITSLVNTILQSKTPRAVRLFFFGVNLTALTMKDGRVRPIAVGCTLWCLVAKSAGTYIMDAMGALLAPCQLIYGTALDCEAAVRNLQPGHVILKLDFKNAFNCIHCDKVLQAVSDLAPELVPFVYSAYSEPSSIFWGETPSCRWRECNKEIPLGPYCSASPFTSLPPSWRLYLFYLDDGTLGGEAEQVLQDLLLIVFL